MNQIENILKKIKEYALLNKVPIIQKEAALYLSDLVITKQPKRILEIGTAIGYSAILMAKNITDNAKITTIEKDLERIEKTISKYNDKIPDYENKIKSEYLLINPNDHTEKLTHLVRQHKRKYTHRSRYGHRRHPARRQHFRHIAFLLNLPRIGPTLILRDLRHLSVSDRQCTRYRVLQPDC